MTRTDPHRVRFGPFEADLETHELWKNGVKLKLGGQPFEILALLLNRPGQLLSREELQKEIWAADTFVDFNHGLNAAVNKLRETLSDSAEEPKYIETLPRRGYRFIGDVETRTEELPAAPSRPPPLQQVDEVSRQDEPSRMIRPAATVASGPKRVRAWRLKAAGAIGVVALLFLWGLALSRGPEIREREERHSEARALRNMLTLVPDPASDPAISPDGKSVAFRKNSYAPGAAGIFVTSSEGKALTQLTEHPGDCCPAWSPDGRMIAFSRIATDEYGIYVVDRTGGAIRKISHADPRKKRGELAWTADGKFIAFSGDSPTGGSHIYLLSLSDASVQSLTEPQGQDRDWGPAYSPDGTRMAFVRSNGAGFPEEIFVMPASGGAARQLTNERAAIMGPPAWSADGQSIIFSSTRLGEPWLWRIPANGGAATQLEETGTSSWHPTVSRQDGKLVVQKILRSSSIYRTELLANGTQAARTVVTSTNGRNEGPQLSPDGRRLLFMSDRSGGVEIWVSNRDGSAAVQLTNLGGCGTPRWSPDGLWVAFDSAGNGSQGVYVISAMGGTARALVHDGSENSVPSWSRDGKWIYFASNRSGQDQLWKAPAEGGLPAQVTRHGGFAALESADGKILYYAKTRFENPEIWRMPVGGGTEAIFSSAVRPKSWAAWSVSEAGIFFIPPEAPGDQPAIDFFDFGTRLTRQVSLLDRSPFWLSSTLDGKEVLYNQAEQDESSILLVEKYQ